MFGRSNQSWDIAAMGVAAGAQYRASEAEYKASQAEKRALEAEKRVTELEQIRSHIQKGAPTEYHAFISHASEDKNEIVRPLASALAGAGFNIWYDEVSLSLGDRLRHSIDQGLVKSRFGIVVLSSHFFAKNWPQYELDGLFAREMSGGKVILPVWHRTTREEVLRFSPSLADRFALDTAKYTIKQMVEVIGKILSKD